MPIVGLHIDWSYNIQSSYSKRPRRSHIEQLCCIYPVSMYLTLVAFSNIVYTIPLYDQPIVPRSLYLPCHRMPISISVTTQARLDLDFGVKVYVVYNFKSNLWIELKLYQNIPELFVYIRVNFQMNY
jgi:hypothetical protein